MTRSMEPDTFRRVLIDLAEGALAGLRAGAAQTEEPLAAPDTAPRMELPLEGPLILSVTQLAERLGISRSAAYEAVRRGEIPSLRLGRRIIVPIRQLEAWLQGSESRGH